jgi:PAS domain S-box-containing protein
MSDRDKTKEELIDDLRRRISELEAQEVEYKRAEEEHKRQAILLKEQADLLELSNDAIMVRDINNTILFWNRGAERMYGWGKEEALGSHSHSLLETQFPKPLEEIEAEFLRDGRWEGEIVQMHSEGIPIMVASQWALQRDEQGNPLAILEINRNITEAKVAEKILKRSERRYRALAEASRIFTEAGLDFQSMLDTVSRSIGELIGDTCGITLLSEDSQSLDPVAFYHPDPEGLALLYELMPAGSSRSSDEIIDRVLETGQPFFIPEISQEISSLINDKYQSYLKKFGLNSLLMVPLRARGRIIGTMSVSRIYPGNPYSMGDQIFLQDLADRAALAVDNARLYGQAQEASRIKDEFLATVSHELRTPLTALLGWSRLLCSGKLDEETSLRAIEIVERNARAQAQLIEDLLDISRIISGKLYLNINLIDLKPIVELAVDAVRPVAEAKEIKMETHLEGESMLLSGDPDRLQQVIWNLLSNAVKFTSRGGRVELILKRVDSNVEITVRDTGEGISAEFLPYVFDRFRQADSSTTRSHGGLGLGLAIVRHLVELHGGSVRAESEGEGRGATFTVRLPSGKLQRDEGEMQGREIENRGQQREILKGLRVLVVDDELDARELFKFMLAQYGAEVKVAATAAEALEEIERSRPDVLVSDIGMPGEDGYDLIHKVREQKSVEDIPAIALTAYARLEERIKALAAGYQMHIPKPVGQAEIVSAVAKVAGRKI